jgi:hypothetical protein
MVTNTHHEYITALYREGVPVAEIACRADVCVKTVRNVARRAGVPPRIVRQPERDAAIVERYEAGEPVAGIAAAHGVRPSRVRLVAARAGLPPRHGWQRSYPIDEHVFDRPDAVGWWLVGLLAADGSVHEPENRISLCQTVDDADVLHAFYAHVGCPERPLTMLNLSDSARRRALPRRPAAEARVFSKHMVEALRRYGVVARKSKTLELSPDAARQPAVWLGLLDGDGSAGIYRSGRDPRVRFSGTRRLMEQCEQFWRHTLGFRGPRPAATPHCKDLWQFTLYGPKARSAAPILLASSPTSLRRKRELLAEIAAWDPTGSCAPMRHQASS